MNRLNYYVEGRAFEWVLACSMLFLSIEILIWPNTLDAKVFTLVLLFISNKAIGVLLFILGWAKFCGLVLNGQIVASIKIGPVIRAVASVLSSAMWAQFALSLLRISIERGRPSIILPFWVMFTIGELYVAYTTIKNA